MLKKLYSIPNAETAISVSGNDFVPQFIVVHNCYLIYYLFVPILSHFNFFLLETFTLEDLILWLWLNNLGILMYRQTLVGLWFEGVNRRNYLALFNVYDVYVDILSDFGVWIIWDIWRFAELLVNSYTFVWFWLYFEIFWLFRVFALFIVDFSDKVYFISLQEFFLDYSQYFVPRITQRKLVGFPEFKFVILGKGKIILRFLAVDYLVVEVWDHISVNWV